MVSCWGKLVTVSWSMELDLISLKHSTISSSRFGSVSGFGIALGLLSAGVQYCVSVLLKDWRGVSRHWCLLTFGCSSFWF